MTMTISGSSGLVFPDGSGQETGIGRNRIINGDMRIAQRGTSTSFGSGGGTLFFGTDRFNTLNYNWSAGSNITVSQDTTVFPTGFNASYKWANGATGLTFGSGGYQAITQLIEGYNIADCYNKTVTLSFWVRSSTAGTYSLNFVNQYGSYGRYIVKTYTINSVNTWEYKTITVDLSVGTASGTWNTTNGEGLAVSWMLGTASDRTGNAALDTWYTAGSLHFATSSSVNLATIANSTFYLTGVQLEIGSTATPFERRMYGQELALCQRYYQLFNQIPSGATRVAGASPAAQGYLTATLPTQMRSAPTISLATSGTNVATGFSYALSNGASDHTLSAGNNLEIQSQTSTVDILSFIMKSTAISWGTDKPLLMTSGKVYASAEL